MTAEKEQYGPEMTRLTDRLYNNANGRNVKNFNVFPGPEWNNMSLEDRAASINKMLDALENGDCEKVEDLDD